MFAPDTGHNKSKSNIIFVECQHFFNFIKHLTRSAQTYMLSFITNSHINFFTKPNLIACMRARCFNTGILVSTHGTAVFCPSPQNLIGLIQTGVHESTTNTRRTWIPTRHDVSSRLDVSSSRSSSPWSRTLRSIWQSSWRADLDSFTVHRIILHVTKLFIIEFSFSVRVSNFGT